MAPFWTLARRLLLRRGMLIAAVCLAFVSAAGLGVGLLSLGPMLSQILHPESGAGLRDMALQLNAEGGFWHIPDWLVGALPEGRFNGVLFLIVGIWCLTVIGAIANFLHQFFSQTIATLTIADIRKDLFVHVMRLPLPRVVEKGSSEYLSRIIRDTAALEGGFIGLLGKAIAQLMKGLAALIVAVIFDWKIVVVAIIVGPILGIILRKIAKRIRRGAHGSLVAQQELLKLSGERVQGMRAVKTSTSEPEAIEQFDRSNLDVIRHELRMRTAKAMSSPIMETLAIIVLGGLALLAANSILKGTLPFERFLLSVGSLAVAGASFRPLAGIVTDLSAASAPAARLLEVLRETTERDGGSPLPRHTQSIAFEQVSYTYPNAASPSIVDVSFDIAFGEHIAFVGPNGSGKTTLLSMIPSLLQPTSGVVRIDGQDAATVSLRDLRRQIGVVTQETFIVQGTIASNIALGMPEADRREIENAADASRSSDFIASLPKGLDTEVAEQGGSLSGGQRQRLAIARALLRKPAILILDEATSQVDSASEAAIAEAVRQVDGCTVLVIAHRLATVLDCNRIVVMDEGRIIDIGTHAELLDRCSLYEKLIQTQLVQVES